MAYSVNDTISMSMYGTILPQNVMTQLPSTLTLTGQGQVDGLQGYSHATSTPLQIPQMSSAGGAQNYLVVPPDTPRSIAGGTSLADGKNQTGKEESKMKPEILKKMKQLRDERKYCDLWIDVKGVQFQAHRNILAAWSPYFDSQLISEEPMIKDLMIVNYDNYEVFADLLEFLYTGVIAPRETNFLQLLHLAVSFQIDLLKSYCEEFLRCNLHLGNFISTYFLSRKYKLESLEKFIVSFLQMKLSDTVKQSEFMSLPASRFNAFLSSGVMMQLKPEIKLFLIISWVGYDVNEREKYLVLLLGHIDWSTVATDFLLEISRTENFFTSHESSLYLLLQTLSSLGISLGPYEDMFPTLQETHSHLLNEIMNAGIILPEPDDFCPVTVTAVCTKNRSVDVSTCTDLRGLVDQTLTITSTYTTDPKQMDNPTEAETAGMDDYVNNYTNPTDLQDEMKDKQNENEMLYMVTVDEISENEMVLRSQNKRNTGKRKGKSIGVRSTRSGNRSKSPVEAEGPDEEGDVTGGSKVLHVVSDTSHDQNAHRAVTRKKGGRGSRKRASKTTGHPPSETKENLKTEFKEEEEDVEDERKNEDIENQLEEKDFWCNEEDEEDMSEEEWKPEEEEKGGRRSKVKVEGQPRQKRKHNKKHYCPHCEYVGQSVPRLDNHIKRNHENNMTYKCTMCNFSTKWNKKFYQHMKTVHFPGPPFCCDSCTFSCERLNGLLLHRSKHSDERPHACDQCDMRFRTRNNLLAHIKVHTGLKPFACDICHKSFATKNTMEQHRVIHSNDRPYLCDQCGFSSKYQSHLISHKRIHTGKTFPCSYPKCTYSTPKKSQLKSHMRSHLGIRQFTCETCGKSFIEKSHLVRHERIHMAVKPFKCQHCAYSSTRNDKLRDHLLKHHGPDSDQKPQRARKTPKERKTKEKTKLVYPQNDHSGYHKQPQATAGLTMQPQASTTEADVATAILQDIRMMQLGNNMQLIVPVSSDQSAEHVIPAGIERANIIHIPNHEVVETESSADAEMAGATIIPEDHQSYISLGVQQGQTTLTVQPGQTTPTHHQLQTVTVPLSQSGHVVTVPISQPGQTVSVPLSQAGQPGQAQDYGGLSAFMALF